MDLLFQNGAVFHHRTSFRGGAPLNDLALSSDNPSDIIRSQISTILRSSNNRRSTVYKSTLIKMRFTASLATLLLSAIVVTSKGLSFFSNHQRVLDDSLAVPGESPLEYCQPNHEQDLLIIQHVNLTPNPPVAYVIFSDD